MKPSELIEEARAYADYYGHDSEGGITIPFPRDKLLELADRLEMAYDDLMTVCTCEICKNNVTPIPKVCKPCSHPPYVSSWQWRGDEE